jgi:hypothetical protein
MYGLPPTPENYLKQLKLLYGDKADEVLKLYPGATEEEVIKICYRTGQRPLYILQHLEMGPICMPKPVASRFTVTCFRAPPRHDG